MFITYGICRKPHATFVIKRAYNMIKLKVITFGRQNRHLKKSSSIFFLYLDRGDLILSSVMAQSLPTDPIVVLGSPDEVHPGKINEVSFFSS